MNPTDQHASGQRHFVKDASGDTTIENALVILIVAVVSLLALMVVMTK